MAGLTLVSSGTSVKSWTFNKILQEYKNTLVDTPKYQRPDVFGFTRNGTGRTWQRNLIRAILMGNPIPQLHFRYVFSKGSNGLEWKYEIVDGGHRTRTVYFFLNNCIKTPIDCTLTDTDGNRYNIGAMHLTQIIQKYPQLSDYIYNLSLSVVEYENLTDNDAETLFLTLNDLNKMSPADKRNAINNIIADTNRNLGAVDSPNAFSMFTSRSFIKNDWKADYTSLDAVSRESDEIVSWAMYYLYSGGIFAKDSSGKSRFAGMDAQSVLDKMYRDEYLMRELAVPGSKMEKNLRSLLSIVNNIVVKNPRLDIFKKGGKWFAGPLKKLIMLVAEMHNVNGTFNFSKVKINTDDFFTSFNRATNELKNDKNVKPHLPYQSYILVNNKVHVNSVQPANVGDTMYPFHKVFTGGARLDDMLYIYYHYVTKGYLDFGVTKLDKRRDFNKDIVDTLLTEQKNCCRFCSKLLTDGNYAVDHIAPHSFGGPTILENSQILCSSCNGQKSNGMTLQDVVHLCERMNVDVQLKEVVVGLARAVITSGATDRLSEGDIRTVIKLVFGKQ